jgi:hypothetical protein
MSLALILRLIQAHFLAYLILIHPMGKLLKGANGPFSGKVGTVVGYVGDLAVIRARPKGRRKPFSDKELNQQARVRSDESIF